MAKKKKQETKTSKEELLLQAFNEGSLIDEWKKGHIVACSFIRDKQIANIEMKDINQSKKFAKALVLYSDDEKYNGKTVILSEYAINAVDPDFVIDEANAMNFTKAMQVRNFGIALVDDIVAIYKDEE
jgi:hypothetical protein